MAWLHLVMCLMFITLTYKLDIFYWRLHAPELFSVKSTYFNMMSIYYTLFNKCISEHKYHIRLGSSYV
jgi:hypothetical protein